MQIQVQQAFQAEFNVSRETLAHLEEYADLLRKWNPAINLVSKNTIKDLWQRHFYDSAQIYQLRAEKACKWADIGSGGGFPALVLAVMAKETAPVSHFTLVESDMRKSTFLGTVIRKLDLNAVVVSERIEETQPLDADILTARAVAPLEKLLGFANRHLKPGGIALFPKGDRFRDEIEQAMVNWRFDLEEIPSKTNPTGAILKIGDISRV